MTDNRVAVTGAGVVSALGQDWNTVSHRLRDCKNAVRYMAEWEIYKDMKTRLAAPVDNFQLSPSFGVKKRRSMGRVAMLAVDATERALGAAGLLNSDILRDGDTGVSFGSSTGSSQAALEFFHLLEHHSSSKINGTTYLRMMSHTAAINISVCFGTTGRMITTSTACTAGSQGVGYAYETIKNGQQKIMIAGGAEELCPTQAAVFDTVFAASTLNDQPKTTPRPFDVSRDGLVLGEGACTLILEDWDHAVEREANIIGEIVGFSTNTDGLHVVKPNKESMTQVMKLALDDAGISPSEIGYICGHGTATEHGDIAESHATSAVFGLDTAFSALKGYTGHTLGACGAFETWVTLHMLRDGWFAPNLNLQSLDTRCASMDYIVDEPRKLNTEYAITNNFAFGGVNTSLVLRQVSG